MPYEVGRGVAKPRADRGRGVVLVDEAKVWSMVALCRDGFAGRCVCVSGGGNVRRTGGGGARLPGKLK